MEGVKIKRPIQAKQIEDIENINLNLGKTIVSEIIGKKIKEEVKRHYTHRLEVNY
jgi:hypothetical protein